MSGQSGKKLLLALVIVLLAAYPVAVYFGLAWLPPGSFGLILAGLALARIFLAPGSLQAHLPLVLPMVAVVIYSLGVAITGNLTMLRFYPVLVSVLLCLGFLSTLIRPPVMIERIARARGEELPDDAAPYLTAVTIVWTGFFVVNALIAAYTATRSDMQFWALYNGFISYCLIGLLLVIELPIRKLYKARMQREKSA